MVPGIVALVLAADRSSLDPTAILGLLLALGGVYVTLRPPRRKPVVRVLAAGCLAVALWLILTYFSASVPVRILASLVLLLVYLGSAFVIDTRVTKEHRRQLNRILDTASHAIKARTTVNLTPEESSILSRHFQSVGQDVTRWNDLFGNEETRQQQLRAAMADRLDPLLDATFRRDALLDGLLAITVARAFAGRLDEPLPPILNTKDAIFRIWPGPDGIAGYVYFGEHSGARGTVCTFPDEALSGDTLDEHARSVLDPVYAFLVDVQKWSDARALPYAHTDVDEFPRDRLQTRLRAARRRKLVRRVQACPICAREAPAQA